MLKRQKKYRHIASLRNQNNSKSLESNNKTNTNCKKMNFVQRITMHSIAVNEQHKSRMKDSEDIMFILYLQSRDIKRKLDITSYEEHIPLSILNTNNQQVYSSNSASRERAASRSMASSSPGANPSSVSTLTALSTAVSVGRALDSDGDDTRARGGTYG